VLPAGSRLTRRDEFTRTVRRGRRVGRPRLVVHLFVPAAPDPADAAPRAGFVVSRAVGGSVVRHRVARRLRHLVRDHLADLPPGARLVVRALPPAASAPSAALADDLGSALRSVRQRLGLPGPGASA
jgi:ribonuclease P protein component